MRSPAFLIAVMCVFLRFNSTAQIPPVSGPIQGPSTVCTSAPASYSTPTSNSPTTFYWFGSDPSIAVVNTGSVANITFGSPGTYTILCQASNSSGSGNYVTKTITVFETPSVSFSGNTIFCQGSSTNLSASPTVLSGSSTIFYSWVPVTGLSSSTSGTVIASPSVTTTYSVKLIMGACTGSTSVTINVQAPPSVTATVNHTQVCSSDPVTLNVTGTATSYSLVGYPQATSYPFTFTPSASATLSVLGYDSNGCVGNSTVTVKVVACPGFVEYSREEGLNVFPNPAAGRFFVRSTSDTPLHVIDQLGRNVWSGKTETGATTEISGLSPGIYFVLSDKVRLKVIVTD